MLLFCSTQKSNQKMRQREGISISLPFAILSLKRLKWALSPLGTPNKARSRRV